MKKAQPIPWSEIEQRYAALFVNRKGNVAKPLRLALGACICPFVFRGHFNSFYRTVKCGGGLKFDTGFLTFEKTFGNNRTQALCVQHFNFTKIFLNNESKM